MTDIKVLCKLIAQLLINNVYVIESVYIILTRGINDKVDRIVLIVKTN